MLLNNSYSLKYFCGSERQQAEQHAREDCHAIPLLLAGPSAPRPKHPARAARSEMTSSSSDFWQGHGAPEPVAKIPRTELPVKVQEAKADFGLRMASWNVGAALAGQQQQQSQ